MERLSHLCTHLKQNLTKYHYQIKSLQFIRATACFLHHAHLNIQYLDYVTHKMLATFTHNSGIRHPDQNNHGLPWIKLQTTIPRHTNQGGARLVRMFILLHCTDEAQSGRNSQKGCLHAVAIYLLTHTGHSQLALVLVGANINNEHFLNIF